ncbi:BRO family protein [Sulfurimonas sp.]|uniref:BRO family protein n=1 Tax=Sulfurimonas sp. TaxID=2022749 RepID=UPI002B4A6F7E|nr:BRO family protein [Sulfurimonas sp.]
MTTITKTFADDIELHLITDARHEFMLPTKEVALGFGVTSGSIREHKSKNKDELIEGKHWITKGVSFSDTLNNQQQMTLWTKRGLVRLGFFIKSARAKKFRDWCEDLIVSSLEVQPSFEIKEVVDDDKDQVLFHKKYHIFNPNCEFFIEHAKSRAKAYLCSRYEFLISSMELARILGVAKSTIGVLKHYHSGRLEEDKHYVKLGSNSTMWTKEGAAWMALRSGDGSFGKILLDSEFTKDLSMNNQILMLNSYAMIDRDRELSGEEF